MNSYETRRLFHNLHGHRKHCQDGHICVSGLKHSLTGPKFFSSGNSVGLNREFRQVLFKAFRTVTFLSLFFLWSTSLVQPCSTTSGVLTMTIQTLHQYGWGSFFFHLCTLLYNKAGGFFILHVPDILKSETNYSFVFSSQFLFLQLFFLSHRYCSST